MKYYGPRQLKKTRDPTSVTDPREPFTPENTRFHFERWKLDYEREKRRKQDEEENQEKG